MITQKKMPVKLKIQFNSSFIDVLNSTAIGQLQSKHENKTTTTHKKKANKPILNKLNKLRLFIFKHNVTCKQFY